MVLGRLGDQYIMTMKVWRYVSLYSLDILLEFFYTTCTNTSTFYFLFKQKQKTRQTLNTKLSQLNAAIDNVSTRLRGGNNAATVPESDQEEVEAAS